MQKEIEIKFRCTDNVLKAIVRLTSLSPNYTLEKPGFSETHDTYLDTNDGLLLKRGALLRSRKKSDQLRITFKSNPSHRGNQLTREEWEQEVSRKEFQALLEAGRVPDFCASAVQSLAGEEALFPVLEIRNRRKVRCVTHKERGMVAEVSLDDATFFRNGKKVPYFGIEVELKGNGNDGDLENLSAGLRKMFPELEPDGESKYEKGMGAG